MAHEDVRPPGQWERSSPEARDEPPQNERRAMEGPWKDHGTMIERQGNFERTANDLWRNVEQPPSARRTDVRRPPARAGLLTMATYKRNEPEDYCCDFRCDLDGRSLIFADGTSVR